MNRVLRSPQPHSRRFVWIGRVVLGLLLALVALAALGATYQALATRGDRQADPPPGHLVDVGGYKLHLFCLGEGAPTVILDAGQPLGTPSWAWIQPEVAKSNRVCAYDRAGLGWSDAGPAPRDGQQMAYELHTLLQNAGAPSPYVLVGHSFGGLITHLFAVEYANEVAGVVWIEALHPDNFPRRGQAESTLAGTPPAQIVFLPWLARLGILRLLHILPTDPALPAHQQDVYRTFFDATQTWDAIVAVEQSFPTTNQQARQAGSIGALPLLVVIGGASEANGVGLAMQQELQALSTNSRQRVIPGATHNSLLHRQDHAQQTSQAIMDVVAAVRAGKSLP